MGAKSINPNQNIFTKYKEMYLINSYRFGTVAPPVTNNTFIGGVASVINTPALLAAKLRNYPSGTAFDSANIQNFTIVGSDIECYIEVNYTLPSGSFDSITVLKSFEDYGGFLKSTGRTFLNSNNLEVFYAKSLVSFGIGGTMITSNKIRVIYIPECTNIGGSAVDNGAFIGANSNTHIYVHTSQETINGGAPDGDIADAISRGADVNYVTDFTAPNSITDLTIGNVYGTAIQLNFTEPTGSTNAIEFYEVWINGRRNNKAIYIDGCVYAVGLTLGATYNNIEVKPVDIYYNKSTSNIVSQATSATYVIPTANIVSNWQMENNVLDSVGSNDGTATAITYAAGLVGQAAVFNGTTSIVKMSGYNTGFNAVDFSVIQLFKTTQTTAYRLLQNRGQGGGGVTKGWQISCIATGNWGNIVIDDGLGHFMLMDNISYLENDNVWHSLIMTWEASTGTCRVYIDGVFKGLKTDALLINADLNGLDVCFGGSNTNGQLFNGQGDEASILNILLNGGQVLEINAKLLSGQHLI